MCLSIDDKLLFTASLDKTIKIFNNETLTEVITLTDHKGSSIFLKIY